MPAPQIKPLPFATIIHLGAGKGERLQEFRDRGTRQIILVEPATDAARSLERMTAVCTDARVINAAAASRDGTADLRLWTLSRLNSLAPVTPEMHELYPGLRQRSRQSVRLLSPRSLLAEIGEVGSPLLLVVETPGAERDVLAAWKSDGLLEQVDQIELHCAEEILFEGAATRAELEAWLADELFVVTARESDDPDWTILQLRADRTARALKRAQAETAEHLETISRQAKALAERDADLEKASARLKEQDAAHTQACKERDKAIADLEVATQMQGLLKSDLDDLRARYRLSEEARASQEALLRKLLPSLQEAAHELRQMPAVAEPDAGPRAASTSRAKRKPRTTTARKDTTGEKSADAG